MVGREVEGAEHVPVILKLWALLYRESYAIEYILNLPLDLGEGMPCAKGGWNGSTRKVEASGTRGLHRLHFFLQFLNPALGKGLEVVERLAKLAFLVGRELAEVVDELGYLPTAAKHTHAQSLYRLWGGRGCRF